MSPGVTVVITAHTAKRIVSPASKTSAGRTKCPAFWNNRLEGNPDPRAYFCPRSRSANSLPRENYLTTWQDWDQKLLWTKGPFMGDRCAKLNTLRGVVATFLRKFPHPWVKSCSSPKGNIYPVQPASQVEPASSLAFALACATFVQISLECLQP